ncbi:MAG TPA: hypothetical protein VHH91_13045, partial [Vicinamibacterales bacterium]|nr:hypothetical protein [Vicinamibacterales bacterium]
MRSRSRRLAAIVPIVWLMASPTYAQEPATRAEENRARREEKSAAAHAYEPGTFERSLKFFEEKGVFLLDREGFYPKLGSLAVGSGFAYGAGFRDRDLFNDRGRLDVWAARSVRGYWATEARFTFPELAGNHLHLESWIAHRDYPEEDYFGLGPDSNRSDRTSYAINSDRIGGLAGVRPLSKALLGGGFEYLNPRLGRGQDDRFPSIEEIFDPATAPGLGESVDYLRSIAFLEVDYREPRNARRGGWYRVEFSHVDDRTTGTYTFNRVDTDLRQFIGFLADRRVLAARLFVSTSDTGEGHIMPFYLMPTLGGNDTLRGFREYRFRGPHAILLQGEYRFEVWS